MQDKTTIILVAMLIIAFMVIFFFAGRTLYIQNTDGDKGADAADKKPAGEDSKKT